MRRHFFKAKTMGAVTFGLSLALFSGCASITGENCPYVVDDMRIELGEKEYVCNFMSANFNFYNSSEKDVDNFSVSFLLFDEDGNNPFFGTNRIISDCKIQVAKKECAEISIALDDYLTTVPENPFEIDYFYVKKINYTDGTTWEDLFGMYARSAKNEED